MRFFYSNQWDDSDNAVTSETEDADYPLTNIRDYQLSKTYRSTSASAQFVMLDGGASGAITATMVWLAGYNLTASMSATLQTNNNDSWGSPPGSVNLTYDANIIYTAFSTASFRYWRFNLDDTSIADDFIEVGRIGVGTYFDLTHAARAGAIRRTVDTSRATRSPTGQIYGFEGITYVEYDMDFSYWDDAERVNIESMYTTVKMVKPIVFIPNPSDTTLDPVYGIISNFELSHIFAWKWRGRLTISEAL